MDTPTRTGAAAGAAAGVPARGLLAGNRRAIATAGLAVTGLTAGALVALGGLAHAGNPPVGPGNIEIFPARDMVAMEGYTAQAGSTATVTVERGGTVIGIGRGVVDDTGFLEFNHPGGSCWDTVTPDIRGGDLVEVGFEGFAFVDGAVTSSAVIPKIPDPVTGEPVTAIEEAPPGQIDGPAGGQWYWVKIAGTYDVAQLQPEGETTLSDPARFLDPSRFVVEIVNPAMREGGSLVGERAIGWSPVPEATDPEDPPPTYTTEGSFDGDGTFAAYFGLPSESDRDLALAGEHVAVSWMADHEDPEVEFQRGVSLYEAGETNGPGFGECPPGPGNQHPVAPSSAVLTTFDGTGDIQVDWTPAQQPPDADDVIGHRVSAVDPTVAHRQEVGVEVDGSTTSATITGLQPGVTYAVEIEADNGQWSDPVPLGSATPGTAGTVGSVGGGGSTEEPPPAEPTGPAPTGVTATATGTGSVDVDWTAGVDAASHEVGLTPTAGGEPVTRSVTAPATTAAFTGLSPGTEYSVVVTAVTAGGTRTAADAVLVTTMSAAAPTAATVTRAHPVHEAIALEWTPAAPGNEASPVTGYDLVAIPVASDGTEGTAVTVQVGAVTNGTIGGLANHTAYRVEVYARSGDLRGPVSTLGAGVGETVTPLDHVTVGRSEYRSVRGEYKISGTVQDATGNTVTVRTSAGALIGSIDVTTAAWSLDLRNGPTLPADRLLVVESTSGAHLETTVQRVR